MSSACCTLVSEARSLRISRWEISSGIGGARASMVLGCGIPLGGCGIPLGGCGEGRSGGWVVESW
eukprot:CAMPEP_0181182282 /NCGR_PEP_ID=MMETSP1096-20121128/7803_1 /TAXON_ID=156174 ORGANISM="Chrysochromulina ericina, Strain CCMP281" /NCGR_SAMPLE_ID=MMETSP1096 /ASSEMBLY_ACC=CAM_ASM_000453 /LENGTH=64 /DNA_ID=CAMNT_0023270873 /DNA_START=509 /DNA_END=703 /DNA_ORIENTATION=-